MTRPSPKPWGQGCAASVALRYVLSMSYANTQVLRYVCIHIYIHTNTQFIIYIHMYVYIYMYVYVYVYLVHSYIYSYVFSFVSMFTFLFVCIHVYTFELWLRLHWIWRTIACSTTNMCGHLGRLDNNQLPLLTVQGANRFRSRFSLDLHFLETNRQYRIASIPSHSKWRNLISAPTCLMTQ